VNPIRTLNDISAASRQVLTAKVGLGAEEIGNYHPKQTLALKQPLQANLIPQQGKQKSIVSGQQLRLLARLGWWGEVTSRLICNRPEVVVLHPRTACTRAKAESSSNAGKKAI